MKNSMTYIGKLVQSCLPLFLLCSCDLEGGSPRDTQQTKPLKKLTRIWIAPKHPNTLNGLYPTDFYQNDNQQLILKGVTYDVVDKPEDESINNPLQHQMVRDESYEPPKDAVEITQSYLGKLGYFVKWEISDEVYNVDNFGWQGMPDTPEIFTTDASNPQISALSPLLTTKAKEGRGFITATVCPKNPRSDSVQKEDCLRAKVPFAVVKLSRLDLRMTGTGNTDDSISTHPLLPKFQAADVSFVVKWTDGRNDAERTVIANGDWSPLGNACKNISPSSIKMGHRLILGYVAGETCNISVSFDHPLGGDTVSAAKDISVVDAKLQSLELTANRNDHPDNLDVHRGESIDFSVKATYIAHKPKDPTRFPLVTWLSPLDKNVVLNFSVVDASQSDFIWKSDMIGLDAPYYFHVETDTTHCAVDQSTSVTASIGNYQSNEITLNIKKPFIKEIQVVMASDENICINLDIAKQPPPETYTISKGTSFGFNACGYNPEVLGCKAIDITNDGGFNSGVNLVDQGWESNSTISTEWSETYHMQNFTPYPGVDNASPELSLILSKSYMNEANLLIRNTNVICLKGASANCTP